VPGQPVEGRSSSRSGTGEHLEEETRAVFGVEDSAHLVAACPEAVEAPMLELDAGFSGAGGLTPG
jgi:hypothetical protein